MRDRSTSDTFLYFAYGSNMCSRRLHRRTPSARALTTGYVTGRKLTFDKVSSDGSGKCDIELTNLVHDVVYGVLFEISVKDCAALDLAEGLGHGYERADLTVVTATGLQHAVAYVATLKDASLLPYNWYLAFVVAGAEEHNLPIEYVARLRQVSKIVDPNMARAAREQEVLWEASSNSKQI